MPFNTLPNLTDEEKKVFQDKIKELDKISDINPILEDALAQDAQNLNAAKDEAKKNIDKMDNLSKDEKDAFKNEIDGVTDIKDIKPIEDKAAEKDAQNLKDAKDEAKKNIDKMNNLSDKEKQDFKDRVDGATKVEDVKAIEKEAQDLNDKNKAELDKHKDDANKGIDGLDNLTPEEKDKIKEDINNGKTKEDVNKIVEEAEKADKEKQAEKDNDNNKPDQIGQTPLINLIIKSGDKILLNISDVVNNKDSKHDEWKQFVENTHAFENHVRQWGKKHGYELTEIQVREIQVLMSMLMSERAAKANSFENGKAYEVVVEMVPVDSKDDSNKSTDDDKNGTNKPNTDGKNDSNKSTDTDKNGIDNPKTDGKDDSNKSTDDDKNGTDKPNTDGKDDSNKSTDTDKNGIDNPKTDGKDDSNKSTDDDKNGVIENMAFDTNKLKTDKVSLKDAVESSGSKKAEQEELPNTGSETTNTTAALAGLAVLLGTMGTFFRRKKG
ncbi:LPXTG cell wall anchor domain-containing protein [Weissella ceti]|uniref:LPXTG cell wall anchor domain-containing protein n=2 Tax=Weissella ceti TaxID=759620 RepID=A0ABT3E5W4_9LACO|nr:LPXTG cell wall anchor domain-containing protein [Weissella ceti]MCW0953293.1 LPXTG cell wall anchor domain-containing protein [Weissella ceti]